jgi:hypothetical protein
MRTPISGLEGVAGHQGAAWEDRSEELRPNIACTRRRLPRVAGVAKVSVVLNQVAVWIESDHEVDIFDLRNVVKNLVQSHLDMVGYVKGHA